MATSRSRHFLGLAILLLATVVIYCFPFTNRVDSFAPLRNSAQTLPAAKNQDNQQQEIEILREKMANLSWQILLLQKQIEDLTAFREKFPLDKISDVIPASILAKRDAVGQRSTFVVDRGKKDGVAVGAPVISGYSLVGKVWEVGNQTSRVLQISDPACQIGVMLVSLVDGKEVKYGEGICVGKGKFCQLQLVEKDYQSWSSADVLTSGFQNDCPPGLLIGSIKLGGQAKTKTKDENVEHISGEEVGLFWNLRVKPKDIDNLHTVLIIKKSP